MTLSELEKRLQDHASGLKETLAPPFDIEREELTMTKKQFSIKRYVLLAVAIISVFGTTVFATVRYLNAKEVANALGETELAQLFDEQGYLPQTFTDGKYKSTVLGITTGKNLNHYLSDGELLEDRTYVVVSVEKADGTPMNENDEVMVTSLISGQEPWRCNIFTLNGGHTEKILEGVLYRIIDCDSLQYFADRTVYLAIYEGFAPSAEIFAMDVDGSIRYDESYEGSKAIFELPLDASKADPIKAAEILDQMWPDSEENTVVAQEPAYREVEENIVLEATE